MGKTDAEFQLKVSEHQEPSLSINWTPMDDLNDSTAHECSGKGGSLGSSNSLSSDFMHLFIYLHRLDSPLSFGIGQRSLGTQFFF